MYGFEKYTWNEPERVSNVVFKCGHCGNKVASNSGYPLMAPKSVGNMNGTRQNGGVYICPNCNVPSLEVPDTEGQMIPPATPGNSVGGLPDEVRLLYNEARKCIAADSPTAATMLCRKLLVNVAVTEGAPHGQSFAQYVSYLETHNCIPRKGKDWVDKIRKLGNEANHEIQLIDFDDAIKALLFTEMLLRFLYELPSIE